MNSKNFSIFESIKYGFNQYFNNLAYYVKIFLLSILLTLGLLVIYFSVAAVITVLTAFILSFFTKNIGIVYWITFFFSLPVLNFINQITKHFITSFLIQKELNVKKSRIDFKQLINKERWQFIWIRIKFHLRVILGLILLILPGIYWYFKYYFRGYAFLEKNVTDKEDFQFVAKLTDGIKIKLFLFDAFWTLVMIFFTWLISGFNYSDFYNLQYVILKPSAFNQLLVFLIFWAPNILASVFIYREITKEKEKLEL